MSAHASAVKDPLEQPSGLLPTDAPGRAVRWAGWLLLVVATCVAFFAAFFPLPDTVVAPFEIVAAEGSDPVQSPMAGELVAVMAREGREVAEGEELFRIRSDDIRNAHVRRRQLREDERALAGRGRRLDLAHDSALAIKDAEIVQAERELEFRGKHLETVRDLVRRSERLAADGLTSEIELLRDRLDLAESEKDRLLVEKLVQQVRFQRQERVTTRERERQDEAAEAEKIRFQLAGLDEQLMDSDGDRKSIRSPGAGVITRVEHGSPGSVVVAGAVLAEWARTDARPVARLALHEADMARVKTGQRTRLFLAAYPYQRHGAVGAVISWVSPSPVPDRSRTGFVATADPAMNAGEGLAVRIGMKGEARILVGRRTLLERGLEPIRGARERLFRE